MQRSNVWSVVWLIVFVGQAIAWAENGDWPQWRHDAGHTAASQDDLPPKLTLQWEREYGPREPVWDDPLNQDMMPYDRVFEPVVAAGRLFVGFNDADKVVAMDVRDGRELWTFYTDGPVRFAPAVDKDSVFFTSDDGYLYCVAAADGQLRWRFRGGPSERKVIGNRRVISTWPARGGPVLADDTVYFAASIWPFMGTFIYGVDAATGKLRWINDDTSAQYQEQPHNAPSYAGVAPQGQLAVCGDLLLVPGGRTLPAGFDRRSGELRFFDFGGKGEGGSFVAASDTRAFAHTRYRQVVEMNLLGGGAGKLRVNEPVLSDELLFTAVAASGGESTARVEAYGSDDKRLWDIQADGTGDLIRAGKRLYAAAGGKITAIDLPAGEEGPRINWAMAVDGDIQRLLAASDRLFAVTLDGRIMAFGADGDPPKTVASATIGLEPGAGAVATATRLLEQTGQRQGYALWFGVGDGALLEAVALDSDLHIVGVDPDADRVDALRRRWDAAGLYGDRVTLHVGTPQSFRAPPYMANLMVVAQPLTDDAAGQEAIQAAFESLRPYGGTLWFPSETADPETVTKAVAAAKLPKAEVNAVDGGVVVTRQGALPGAGAWTHTYGDVANTVKSDDARVRLPLGLLWFGGSSNLDVLPRHGHGPSEQVVGGRLFIEGMTCFSARDVYTGRVLWKREFEDLGTYDIYFDDSYADTPLSTAYNQLHIPGANARGANYVATADGVYLALRDRCLLLDPDTGETVREFVLPADADGRRPDWGYIGVYENLLLAGVDFGQFAERLGFEYTAAKKRGPAWSPEYSASLKLVAFDRHSGEIQWNVPSQYSFLHNGMVAGGGRVYLLDKLPKRVEEQHLRRGREEQPAYRLLVIDARTGNEIWSTNEVFGTWLGYSSGHDVLLQAGAAASDRSLDEVNAGMAVYRAGDGQRLWRDLERKYTGPCILYGDKIITNSTSYNENQGTFHLLDGTPVTIEDPVTGEAVPWKFFRNYGCNTAVASEHLLTFRSGAAGFYDLANHSGTGNFGGFKSGCTANLIVADGVLNAPDYTRTCTCGYQNQTSLAMVPMEENEYWTFSLMGQNKDQALPIRRIGLNLGASGDRRADNGTMWVNYPKDKGPSAQVQVAVEGDVQWFTNHSGRVTEGPLPWIAASGAEGILGLTVQLGKSDATRRFTVRLYFAEPAAGTGPGQRVFNVMLPDGQRIAGLDVAAETGGPLRSLVRTIENVETKEALEIRLTPQSDLPPILSGVEIVEVTQ